MHRHFLQVTGPLSASSGHVTLTICQSCVFVSFASHPLNMLILVHNVVYLISAAFKTTVFPNVMTASPPVSQTFSFTAQFNFNLLKVRAGTLLPLAIGLAAASPVQKQHTMYFAKIADELADDIANLKPANQGPVDPIVQATAGGCSNPRLRCDVCHCGCLRLGVVTRVWFFAL